MWFEGLRHHAPFPTSHPNYRQSLPGDAGQVNKALGDADLVLLLGGPFFEDIWFAPGSHFPDGAAVVQVEESPERLALNYRLDAGIVGDIATSLVALTQAVRAGEPGFKLRRSAATRRSPSCAHGKKRPIVRESRKAGAASRARCRGWWPSFAAACPTMP